jgi:6-phosphogluconate dehydrogenase (decarboxylating)
LKIRMIGLGKMGLNLSQNLMRNEIEVMGYDPSEEVLKNAKSCGIRMMESLEKLVEEGVAPKIVWLMTPAGDITNKTILQLADCLSAGDIVIDGGNSHYKDSVLNGQLLFEKGIYFFDCGTSGGTSGALQGGNFMIGGDEEKFAYIEPIFKKIAQEKGYLYAGPSGSGHYLKMVHNGIEYGMMHSIAEGFDLLEHSPYQYDNEKVATLWNHGSVIRSWLIELMENAFSKDPHLEDLKGVMYSSGEGRWSVEEALERNVPVPVIATSLMMRYRSLEEDTFTGKVVAALRNEFGGHAVKK